MWIATGSHFLLQLKSAVLYDKTLLQLVFFQLFLMGFAYIFLHPIIFSYAEFRLFQLPHAIGVSFWVIPYLDPGNYGRTILMCSVCGSLYHIPDIV